MSGSRPPARLRFRAPQAGAAGANEPQRRGQKDGQTGVVPPRQSVGDATLRMWQPPLAAHSFERRAAARATAYRNRPGDGGPEGPEPEGSRPEGAEPEDTGEGASGAPPGGPASGRCNRLLQREAPVGPRGPRRGPQAPGHVHRLDRRPRPAALPLGDLRQLGRRGPWRLLHARRGHPARRRLRRGAGQRPGHPGGQRAEDQALRRRTGHDPAARGRQVRRRLLHGLRRPARRRRVRRERALRAA